MRTISDKLHGDVTKPLPYRPYCCMQGGVLDYIYHIWWRCRRCGKWWRCQGGTQWEAGEWP